MRWFPTEPSCPECGFDWSIGESDAVGLVAGLPARLAGLGAALVASTRTTPAGWSGRGYLWHLVDALRIGTERLLTLALDPAAGIPCWDENDLAAVRKYERLSALVGIVSSAAVTERWVAAAREVPPDAVTEHPQFGTLTALDLIRRDAHEVRHHEMDVHRLLD